MEKVINQDQKVYLIKSGQKITIKFLERKKMARLTKNKYNKMLFGVCSGLADWLNTDPTLVRIVFVVGSLLTGSLLLWVYLLLAILLPPE